MYFSAKDKRAHWLETKYYFWFTVYKYMGAEML